MLARGMKIFVAPGEHVVSPYSKRKNIPWSICVLLTSPLIKNKKINKK